MKISLLVLSLLLSSLCIISSMALTNTIVLDMDGAKLQASSNYYVVPVVRRKGGGGLGIGLRDNTCPFFVLQENFEVSNGIPLRFFHADRNLKAVNISVDVNVVFSTVTTCVQSTAWRLGELDDLTGKRYVKTGGIVGNPGLWTVNNWFKIEKHGGDYKLVYCPSVCKFCKVVCGDLGVLYEDGSIWLALSDVPLAITFKKA
ncbi:hypothetical protein MKW98_013724 [Papaver atlanticum]|uniref:Uncharacterized protein n=1 Tax=Papaver atlanticum TaxID=357466 RepID=A0AAD4SEE9_9MAGN|nr:hypothetical protein MKW98_013724 [Papaver atlanticum]